MATVARNRTATYADLEAVPPYLVAEIVYGSLETHPRPVPRHGAAANSLGSLATGAYQFGSGGPGGWVIIVEPELHLGPHVVVPDLAGWRRERLIPPPDKAYFDVAPDWVCKVLSPSAERLDRGPKRLIYAEHGVEHLWLLDPRSKLLETFQLVDRSWRLTHTFAESDTICASPFDELRFAMSLLFPFDESASAASGGVTDTPESEK